MNLINTLLIFAYDFPPSSGGISRLCYEIAAGQENYFDEVVVLTRKKVGEHQPAKQANFRLIELSAQRLKCEIQAIKVLKKFDKTETTIVCSLWYPEAFLALLSGHKNVYSLAHGAELQAGNSKFRKHLWLALFAKYILKRVKKVISNSHFTKDLVHQISRKSNCEAIPLGVDLEQFKPLDIKGDKYKFTIGSLSRIHQFKGYDQILEALLRLPESKQENIIWKIGGTGPYLEVFKAKLNKLAPKFEVELLGFIPDESLAEFYSQLDVYVLFTQDISSQNSVEGFGLVFLEAQACGTPTIGTNTGGIPDAIDHNNGGWLFEQNDIVGLSNQILFLIAQPEMLQVQSELARRRCCEECTWYSYNKKLKEILQ